MKTEDIDHRIGMPDVDAEWTKFEQEVIETSPVRSGYGMSRAAAIAVVVVGVSLTALASAYLLHVMPSRRAARQQEAVVADTLCNSTVVPDSLAVFIFDNEEMLSIATTLGNYYDLEPQFKDERAKHVRLYARVPKSDNIHEVMVLLNNFKKVKLSVHDGRLIVESGTTNAAGGE